MQNFRDYEMKSNGKCIAFDVRDISGSFFSGHGLARFFERTKQITIPEILLALKAGLYVIIKEERTSVRHKLIFPPGGDEWIVIVQDDENGEIISVLSRSQYISEIHSTHLGQASSLASGYWPQVSPTDLAGNYYFMAKTLDLSNRTGFINHKLLVVRISDYGNIKTVLVNSCLRARLGIVLRERKLWREVSNIFIARTRKGKPKPYRIIYPS